MIACRGARRGRGHAAVAPSPRDLAAIMVTCQSAPQVPCSKEQHRVPLVVIAVGKLGGAGQEQEYDIVPSE
jgi:hypothetical protein